MNRKEKIINEIKTVIDTVIASEARVISTNIINLPNSRSVLGYFDVYYGDDVWENLSHNPLGNAAYPLEAAEIYDLISESLKDQSYDNDCFNHGEINCYWVLDTALNFHRGNSHLVGFSTFNSDEYREHVLMLLLLAIDEAADLFDEQFWQGYLEAITDLIKHHFGFELY